MSSMQKLILIGYLGKDPETRYTPSGTAITNFTVATSERWKDKQSGEQQERTTWHFCEAWGKLAEICGEYLKKGSHVYVEGQIRNEEWEKDGETKRMTKVRMDNMQMLSAREGTRSASPPPPSAEQRVAAAQAKGHAAGAVDLNEDIPF